MARHLQHFPRFVCLFSKIRSLTCTDLRNTHSVPISWNQFFWKMNRLHVSQYFWRVFVVFRSVYSQSIIVFVAFFFRLLKEQRILCFEILAFSRSSARNSTKALLCCIRTFRKMFSCLRRSDLIAAKATAWAMLIYSVLIAVKTWNNISTLQAPMSLSIKR